MNNDKLVDAAMKAGFEHVSSGGLDYLGTFIDNKKINVGDFIDLTPEIESLLDAIDSVREKEKRAEYDARCELQAQINDLKNTTPTLSAAELGQVLEALETGLSSNETTTRNVFNLKDWSEHESTLKIRAAIKLLEKVKP